jgi:hypothetical protein
MNYDLCEKCGSESAVVVKILLKTAHTLLEGINGHGTIKVTSCN